MKKTYGAVVREHNGMVRVLTCSNGGKDERGEPLPPKGTVLRTENAKNYGDGLFRCDVIDGRYS